jgi:hypothetical protein
MRIYSVVSATISGILMAGASTLAFAGSCANGKNCNTGYNDVLASYEGVPSAICRTRLAQSSRVSTCITRSVVHPAAADPLAPVNYYNSMPYGYLKTFAFKNTPDVNIMRINARAPIAPLNNVPTRFANTGFSGAGFSGAGFTGGCNTFATSSCSNRSVIAVPAPTPVYRPVYNPAYRPAPLPVVRKPVFQPAPIAPIAPIAPVQFRTNNMVGGNVIGHVSTGSYTVTKPGTPDYWEKTSGATVVGGLAATQIVCRRAGTAGTTQTVNVVRPVIGVPQAVPTAVPNCLPAQRSAPFTLPMSGPMSGNRWKR